MRTRAALDEHAPFAGVQPLEHDLRVVESAEVAGGEDHRFAAREQLRPAVAVFGFQKSGDLLRLAPSRRDSPDAGSGIWGENDGVIISPACAAKNSGIAEDWGAPPPMGTFFSWP